ncbi:hypothetical protein [Leptolyngbya sp. PCC 6406]|uniref:hypothetical protein n=1 Tax=Leptolyngbya sp. PCC 6406 TaxID=1173264 RepID=UPI0002AB9C6C|nr:hypothetical protein [Leptolyngbya sp. PCC 6406]
MQRVNRDKIRSFWLSWSLLILAYGTYGQLLHGVGAEQLVWVVSLIFVVVKAGIFTLLWHPTRRFVLLGFQSDIGYLVMALMLASLVVLAVVQFRAFIYVVVLVATTILVRIDCLTKQLGDRLTFLALLGLPLVGMGLSWLLNQLIIEVST